MADRAAELIAALGLVAHPEGGFYREIFRAGTTVRPEDGRGTRSALTTIYFLLAAGAVSRWHRLRSDEVWHFYEGAPLELWTAPPGGAPARPCRLGPLGAGQGPVRIVPAGWWQAARSTGGYTLVGCSVGPGFDFADFVLAAEEPEVATAFRGGGVEVAALL